MQLRPATLEDIPAILALIGRVVPIMQASGNRQWDSTYPNARVFEHDVAHGQLWVAEFDEHLAGVAAITAEREPEYAHVGWDFEQPALVIHRLAVEPAFRGQGIATALLRHAETLARARGIDVLRTDTSADNGAAQRLFPRLGYVFSGEITIAFRPGVRVLCYERRIQPSEEPPPATDPARL